MENKISPSLIALKKSYVAQLPEKINHLDKLFQSYESSNEICYLESLKRAAHTLCGTSGTYGCHLVSEGARKIEKILSNLDQIHLNESTKLEIKSLIQDLNQLVLQQPADRIDPVFQFDEFMVHVQIKTIYIFSEDISKNIKGAEYLRQFDYIVKSFTELENFVSAIKEYPPSLVIIDINLAKYISSDIIMTLRDELIIIIYMGNVASLTDQLLSIRHGGERMLSKPLDPETIVNSIDHVFETRKIQHEKVLIVDDSLILAEYFAAILENIGMVATIISDPKFFLTKLEEVQPDIILLDINMPFCNGLELAQIVQQLDNFSGIPIIFLSSIAEKAKQLEVLSFAGDDFLTKPVNPKHLVSTVQNRLMRSRMLRYRLMRDSLTNLYNHTMILHQLERQISLAKRYNQHFCVALLDLDHFKKINDTYGHQAGDKILKDLSVFLEKNLRQSDIVGRYGGEEFLLILPDTKMKYAFHIINQLRNDFSNLTHVIAHNEISVTLSGGLASFPNIPNAMEIVKAADDALYRAKNFGRNQIVINEDSTI